MSALQIVPPTVDRLTRLADDRTRMITVEELAALVAEGLAFVVEGGGAMLAVSPKHGDLWVIAARADDDDNPADWATILPALDELAASMKVNAIRLMGRTGWLRRLSDFGYTQTGIVMSKEVSK